MSGRAMLPRSGTKSRPLPHRAGWASWSLLAPCHRDMLACPGLVRWCTYQQIHHHVQARRGDMLQPPQSPFVPHNLKQSISGRRGGPLRGLSVVVKDMYDIAGERAGGGSPAWLADQEPAKRHSAVVQAVLDAGAR